MKIFRNCCVALLASLLTAGLARAQTGPTPQQIQDTIGAGQGQEAMADLQTVLQTHPDSGEAWYLAAEADDAMGNEIAAQQALGKAERYAPGLPFALPSDVTALRAHIVNPTALAPYQPRGIRPFIWIVGGMGLLFVLFRLCGGRLYQANFGGGIRDDVLGGAPGWEFGNNGFDSGSW